MRARKFYHSSSLGDSELKNWHSLEPHLYPVDTIKLIRGCLMFMLISCVYCVHKEVNMVMTADGRKVGMNETKLNICPSESENIVFVCSRFSFETKQDESNKPRKLLIFKVNGITLQIYIDRYFIVLPNASLSFEVDGESEVPLYLDEVQTHISSFYMGSLHFTNYSIPFSAEFSHKLFIGQSFLGETSLQFLCGNISEASFYTINDFFNCTFQCTTLNIKKEHIMNNSYTDYVSIKNLEDSEDILSPSHSLHHHAVFQLKSKRHVASKEFQHISSSPAKEESCSLHLVADHLYFKYVGKGNVMHTINSMFKTVYGVDSLFRSTDFDGNGEGDNIGFVIGKVTVFRNESGPDYKLNKVYMNSDDYLRQFSFYNFSSFCLGVGFTHRDFGKVAGSAFPAFSQNAKPGGICQPQIKINSHHVSFNTAIVTTFNNGHMIPHTTVMLTLAHEMGHSFGANHDTASHCNPDSDFGNFLMNTKTSSGRHPNNLKFSSCSIRYMLPVIQRKGSCFQNAVLAPHCGNGIPEVGEECDCGSKDICDFIDPCCTPSDVVSGQDKPCNIKRSQGMQCSPKKHTCCSSSCTFVEAVAKKVCNNFNECTMTAHCDGQNEKCPLTPPKPEGTLCNDGLFVCKGQHCSTHLCEHHHLTTCLCTKEVDECRLCCKDPTNESCKSARDFGIITSKGGPIYLNTGAQCLMGRHCDADHFCVHAMEKISVKNILFEDHEHRLKHVRSFIKNFWLYMFFVIAILIYFFLVIGASFQREDSAHLKALRYGKMIAVFSLGEHQTYLYQKKIIEIVKYYDVQIPLNRANKAEMPFVTAVARLKVLFPEVAIDYLMKVAKISASEDTAVKLLLLQNFRMKSCFKWETSSQHYF